MIRSIVRAQASPTVGDVDGNLAIVGRIRDQAAMQSADLEVFPELEDTLPPCEELDAILTRLVEENGGSTNSSRADLIAPL